MMMHKVVMVCLLVFCCNAASAQGWQALGPDDFVTPTSGINGGNIITYSLTGFNDSQLHVAYIDPVNANKISVRKYDGANWSLVGNAGFTAANVQELSATFSKGQPHVAYRTNNTTLNLIQYNDTGWRTLTPYTYSCLLYNFVLTNDASENPIAFFAKGNVVGPCGFASGETLASLTYNTITGTNNAPGTGNVNFGNAPASGSLHIAKDRYGTLVVVYFPTNTGIGAIVSAGTSYGFQEVIDSNGNAGYFSRSIAIDTTQATDQTYLICDNSLWYSDNWSGPDWYLLSKNGLPTSLASAKLATDDDGHLFIAYTDPQFGQKLVVKYLSGNVWVPVYGNGVVSANAPSDIQFRFIPGSLVITYRSSNQLFAKKFSLLPPSLPPAVSISTNATAAVCPNTSISFYSSVLNAGFNTTYHWLINGINTGVTSPTFADTLTTGDIVSLLVTTPTDSLFSNPLVVQYDSVYRWVGGASGNWNLPSKWCGNVLPTSSTNIVIPSGTTVTINFPAYCHNLFIEPGGTIIMNGGSLEVYGSYQNNGTVNITNGVFINNP